MHDQQNIKTYYPVQQLSMLG